jgi:hypothetical protein
MLYVEVFADVEFKQIAEALRKDCGISTRHYFVAVILDDGTPQTFSGPGTSGLRSGYEKQFFDMDKFTRAMGRLESGW